MFGGCWQAEERGGGGKVAVLAGVLGNLSMRFGA